MDMNAMRDMMGQMRAMLDKMEAMMSGDDMKTMRAMGVDMSDPKAQQVYRQEKRRMGGMG